MRLCSIASGSSGNCIYVGSEEAHVLVDVGISGKSIEKGLNSLDLTGKDVDGILITHEHSDHIKGLGVISRKYGIPIYTTGGTADAMLRMKSLGKMPEGLIHEIREDEPFGIKDLTVNPLPFPMMLHSRWVTAWNAESILWALPQTLENIMITL